MYSARVSVVRVRRDAIAAAAAMTRTWVMPIALLGDRLEHRLGQLHVPILILAVRIPARASAVRCLVHVLVGHHPPGRVVDRVDKLLQTRALRVGQRPGRLVSAAGVNIHGRRACGRLGAVSISGLSTGVACSPRRDLSARCGAGKGGLRQAVTLLLSQRGLQSVARSRAACGNERRRRVRSEHEARQQSQRDGWSATRRGEGQGGDGMAGGEKVVGKQMEVRAPAPAPRQTPTLAPLAAPPGVVRPLPAVEPFVLDFVGRRGMSVSWHGRSTNV
ncbi:hypothetical protein VFPFJ_10117 [Purpureocillium lilacinum]|uniref:Uncharacterized protein n=1 Tax=Purpureocillium lilacinum TaxID=33203 RepID=A0A179GJN1_PURLI|nr:hypothetical protein VFPFJ_10117 [Purpureocillium lilacinum]OAQ78085.1 hypothetical protein VFPFJ_10117 [Purpureocillium lilacinum]